MKKGFTMIELIFVIVILGILAAVAIPKLAATRDDAKLAAIKTDIGTYINAVPAWYQGQKDARIAQAVSLDTKQWVKSGNNELYQLSMSDDKVCVNIAVWDDNGTTSQQAVDGTQISTTDGSWTTSITNGVPTFRVYKPAAANLSADPVCGTLWTMVAEQNVTMAGKKIKW